MEHFEIPDTFWLKLHELTGDTLGRNKGFMCFYFDAAGNMRYIHSPKNDQVMTSALRKKIEMFLDDWNNRDSMQVEMQMMMSDEE